MCIYTSYMHRSMPGVYRFLIGTMLKIPISYSSLMCSRELSPPTGSRSEEFGVRGFTGIRMSRAFGLKEALRLLCRVLFRV